MTKARELAHAVDWWGLVSETPAVLATKTGRLQMTYSLQFQDTEQMPAVERAWYLARLDEVLRMLDASWVLDLDWWHEPHTQYPTTDWTPLEAPLVDRMVDMIRRADYEEHPRHTSTLYTTLSWCPPPPTRQLVQDLLTTKGTARRVARSLHTDIA